MAPHSPGPGRPVPVPSQSDYHEPSRSGYNPYDEPTYGGGFDGREPTRPGMPPGADRMSDMTSEMRFGEALRGPAEPGMPDYGPGPSGPSGRSPVPGPGPGPGAGYGPGPGSPAPPPPPPMSGQVPGPMSGAGVGAGTGELQRVDELRRTFQPRRFGSGYDRGQVDGLFEAVMAGMSGRGPISVSEAELDPRRFDLVPGGYFEAEVEAALDELRGILRRH
jgi:hypothetical protein